MSYLTDFQNFARQLNLNPTMSGYTQQLPRQQLQAGDPNYWQSMADTLRPYTQANEQDVIRSMPGVTSAPYAENSLNRLLEQRTSAVNPDIQGAWGNLLNNKAFTTTLSRDGTVGQPYIAQLFGQGLADQLSPYLGQSKVQRNINWNAVLGADDPAAALTAATRSAALQSGMFNPYLDKNGNIGGIGFASDPSKWAGVFNPSDIENFYSQYQGLGGTRTLGENWQQQMLAARPVGANGQQMGEIGDGSQYLWATPEQGQQWRQSLATPGFGGAPLQGVNNPGTVTLQNGQTVQASSLPRINTQDPQYWMNGSQRMAYQRGEWNPYLPQQNQPQQQQTGGYAPIPGASTQQFNYYSQGTPINNQQFSNYGLLGGTRQYNGLLGGQTPQRHYDRNTRTFGYV